MKSLLVNVFFPAWVWGALNKPHLRFLAFSYSSSLTERDNQKFLDLCISKPYKDLWGKNFDLREQGKVKVSNNKTGWKLASSVGGVGTGERADFLLSDDLHNVKEAESETVREETVRWFRESMSNRLNDMENSVIIVIMQRVNESDVSGVILDNQMEYTHVMIPILYDEGRHCSTEIGWEDPRTEDGELAWPARFSADVVEKMKRDLGIYAFASQYQQAPAPRGGGIFKRDWWQTWEPSDGKWPTFDFLLASLDAAFTTKEENDPSGLIVLGVFKHPETKQPSVMLVKAWRKFLEMHGTLDDREPKETFRQWYKRVEFHKNAGLCEWVAETCRFRNFDGVVVGSVDKLLIESKASGITAAQEMQRLYFDEGWGVELVDPKGDKVARAHSVVPTFSSGLVFAPDRDWADLVIDEMGVFPKGKHDDLTDAMTMALKWLRVNGLIQRPEEIRADERERTKHRRKQSALYPA